MKGYRKGDNGDDRKGDRERDIYGGKLITYRDEKW